MKFDRIQVHKDIQAHRPHCKMDARDALTHLWNLAADNYATNPTPENLSTATWAWDILQQQGCEDFDPAVTDGYLSHLISIIVRG